MSDSLSSTIGKNWQHFTGINLIPSAIVEKRCKKVDILNLDTASTIPQIVWLGHASFLVLWRDQAILIDPVFSKRIGLSPRRVPIAKSLRSISPDAILLSHAHMDHLNSPSLALFPDAPIFIPQKSENFLKSSIRKRACSVVQDIEFNIGPLTVTPLPTLHGGWRYPWQKGYSAVAYLISDGCTNLYYAGDTAYGEHFQTLATSFSIDIACLPIGAYSPRWFLKSRHLNPTEAVQAGLDLKAATIIPFHFGSYRLALDPLNDALPWFVKEADDKGINWEISFSWDRHA
jgi:L-ascorbate metabolism protein UlaG (beta-lactamase superfamily)